MLASFRKTVIALALIFPSAALAQGTVLQGGPFTSGHAPMYVGQGGAQAIVQDAGPAGGGAVGYGLSELAVTARGTGTGPYAGLGTGPFGTVSCINDNAPATANYHYLCFSANAQGGGLIAYGAGGTAAALPLQFMVNGATYPFPFVTGGIVGPGTTVVNDVACWNNTVGTLLKDCGAAVSTSSNNTWTGTNNFTGPFQINGAAQTFPGSGNLVGTSDAQTLTNKSINASEVNSGTLSAVVMPAFTGDVTNSAGSLATTISNGVVTNAKLAVMTQNAVKGAASSTAVADLAMPSCSGAGNALQWVTNTGIQCGTLSGQTAGWGLTGTSTFSISTAAPPFGFDAPINAGLSASAAGSALTINLTNQSGATPSATSPVLFAFRSNTVSTGSVLWNAITAATSITIPSGATLGTTNNVPFRVWVFMQNIGGTGSLQLGVATCSTATQIFPCASWEAVAPVSTTISGLSTAAGTLYSIAGNGGPVRFIGYCDFASGLATVGAWTSSCTTLQLFGPGIKKPGDVVQTAFVTSSTQTAVTGTTFGAAVPSASITPTASPNLISVLAIGTLNTNAGIGRAQIFRNSGGSPACTTAVGSLVNLNNTAQLPASAGGLDAPGSSSQQTYAVCINNNTGGDVTAWCNTASITPTCTLQVQEIQGALDEKQRPANDNGLWQPRMAG